MKILIICAVGMSSSLVVKKMQDVAPEGTIIDYGIGMSMIEKMDGYDVVLFGPQLRYKKDELNEAAENANLPHAFIDMIQYGRAMGKEIYEQAVELYENKGKNR